MKFEYEEGYNEKQVIDPTKLNICDLRTDKDVIEAYAELSKASHHRDSTKNNHGELARNLSLMIVDDVRTRLEAVGWHAHIIKTGSCECNCRKEVYLHAFADMPQITQVPFCSDRNIELNANELFNDDGSLRPMSETLELLRKHIGQTSSNLDKMVEDGDIDLETANIIKSIMEEQELEEIQEVDEDNKTFNSGSETWTWRDSDDDAEEEAKERLYDGELWRMQVQDEATELGLDDWVEQVLSIDGWQHELCCYDGCSYELDNGVVYWRED